MPLFNTNFLSDPITHTFKVVLESGTKVILSIGVFFSFRIGIPEEDIAYIFGNPDILEDNIRPDQQAASSCMSTQLLLLHHCPKNCSGSFRRLSFCTAQYCIQNLILLV